MSRATIFRIVGFAFLAFAAGCIYVGEFSTRGVVITRAHDPESFWQGVLIQIGVGCALLYLSRFSSRGPSSPAGERPKLPNYDPDFCGKVIKGAACVCVGLIVAELLVLLLVHPSDDRCPGWIFHPNQPSAASLWVLAGMFTLLPALWICNVALRWDHHYAPKMYDSVVYGPPELHTNSLVLMVTVGWCLFCAIPLFWMLGQCTVLSHYLNLNAFHF